MDRWTTADGLPIDHVRDVAVDRDGVVWLATLDGLVRFDGDTFTTLRPGDPDGPPETRLFFVEVHPRDGALWVQSEHGTLQRRGQTNTTFAAGAQPSQPRPGIDTIWMVTDGQLVRLDDAPVPQPIPDDLAPMIALTAPDGGLWVQDLENRVWHRTADGVWSRTERFVTNREFLARDHRTGDLDLVGPLRWSASAPPVPLRWASVRDEGALYLDGVRVFDVPGRIAEVAVDGDTVWIATAFAGLLRLRPTAVTTHRAPDGERTNVIRLWADGDALWALGEHSGWWPLRGEGELPIPDAVAAPCPHWTRRYLRADGRLLLACDRYIVDAVTGEDLVHPGRHQSGPAWETARGVLLGGERSDAAFLRDGTWTVLEGAHGVYAMAALDDGALLLGGLEGVAVLDRDAVRATPAPWDVGQVRHLRRDGARIWVSTVDRGLCVTDVSLAPPRCLGPGSTVDRSTVHASVDDGRGRVWLSTNHGLGALPADALDAWADGGAEPGVLWLDERDGMRAAEANGFVADAVVQTADGHLWFATQDGVVEVDTDAFALPPPPKVTWQPARVGAARVPAGERLELAVDHPPVQVGWTTAPSPWVDQVRFRYRVSATQPWSPPIAGRSIEVPALPAGDGVIEVQGRLGDAWGPVARIAYRRAPALYERAMFPLLAALAAVLALFGFAAGRSRVMARLNRELEARVRDQTQQLTAQNTAMADQNRQLVAKNEQIAEQARQLASLDELKRQLIANVSHELRTPLSLVVAPLGNLIAESAPGSRSRRLAELASSNARRVDALIGQLFDLSRAQAGGLQLRVRRVDLRAVLVDARHRFEPLADERAIRITVALPDDPVGVWLDLDLIDKVLGNLLANALRFAPAGSEVTVRVTGDDETVRVEVCDRGPGVPEAARERVFERFYQVEGQPASTRGGTGLGLSLARELVELHGGHIGVEDAAPGARFWFELPRGVAHLAPDDVDIDASAPPPPAEPVDVDLRDRRVLLVEDHPQLRAYLAEVLSERFDVTPAEDGERALEIASHADFDLVISDVMMPGIDGHELTRQLRERPDPPPVLLVSARGELQDRLDGLELADDFLQKPFHAPELVARAQALLRRGEPVTSASTGPADPLVTRLRAAAEPHLGRVGFNATDLAKAMAMSPRTLQLKMADAGLPSPGAWLRHERLERARALLAGGEHDTVAAVADAVGMSRSYFARLYASTYGQAPSDDLAAR